MEQASCPRCGGTGWKTVERHGPSAGAGTTRVAERCDCGAEDRTARTLARVRIPRRYAHCDFENFDTGLYDSEPEAAAWNRSLEQAKLLVEGFARDYPAGADCGLLLMGPCGAGKTHLAVAGLRQLVLRGHDAVFYDYRELLKQIQASYNPENQSTEMSVLEPVLTAELLLLDDLGASKPSAWALDTLSHILNTRYNEKRVTLLTTNYLDSAGAPHEAPRLPSGRAVPTDREDTLADRVGQRIRSRLYEMCRTVELVAPDYRMRIRQASWHRA